MSELVELLRQPCNWCQPCVDCELLMQEAADEIERLREALAASCEENRNVYLAEPGRTATCPLEQELRQNIETLRLAWDSEIQIGVRWKRERGDACDAARWLYKWVAGHVCNVFSKDAEEELNRWPFLMEVEDE